VTQLGEAYLQELHEGEVSLDAKLALSKPLSHTSGYDKAIATYLLGARGDSKARKPCERRGRGRKNSPYPKFTLSGQKLQAIRYGEILINRQLVSNWNYPNWLGGCYQTSKN